jgi:hypothetical protein
VAGAGDGSMANLNGHGAGNGGHSQGEPTDTAPVLDPTFREGAGNVIRGAGLRPTAKAWICHRTLPWARQRSTRRALLFGHASGNMEGRGV